MIETYIGVRTLEEKGVLMCSCVRVFVSGGENDLCVCGGGGWLQIKSDVSLFEGLQRN